ncbi:MAG TPA: phosphoribosylformylglycinamidine synthase I [Fimbriimonadaceae bacterium]|nr:phosphoribosylformylglycinamidine synthase I [Fimbriimonadaceae bacterium]
MRVAVIRFPGANCDQDGYFALNDELGVKAEYVWHEATSLAGFDGAFLPGGFSYGDYLRCGAMAARSPVMDEVRRLGKAGYPVIGVCNGFQVLCEAGLLPGALLLNAQQKFLCQDVYIEAVNRNSMWTRGVDRILRMPIAHGEGRYVCEAETLHRLEQDDRVAFRYVSPTGQRVDEWNPNGSTDAIAGVLNEAGNILGLMPHPERACRELTGSVDGVLILRAFSLVHA